MDRTLLDKIEKTVSAPSAEQCSAYKEMLESGMTEEEFKTYFVNKPIEE